MATQEQKDHVARLRTAYERLLSGQGTAVVVDSTGERVEWRAGHVHELQKYIRRLEMEYGMRSSSSMKPVGVIF